MLEALLQHGGVFTAAAYGSLVVVAAAELWLERRAPTHSVLRRWGSNLALGFLDRTLLRALLPLGAFGLASWSAQHAVGLLHGLPLSYAAAVVAGVLLLDLGAYATHRLEHAVPLLWRLHRVHHADLELDFSSSQRHHPLAAVVTGLVRLGVVVALGIPPASVVGYFLLRGPVDAFSHGNLHLPPRLDRGLRWLVVTPGMHLVHHSALPEETDANFTELLPVWDRLFGTYRDAPALGEAGMTIGLEEFRSARDLDLDRLLLQPFRSEQPVVPATA